jgi:hypothetical protein
MGDMLATSIPGGDGLPSGRSSHGRDLATVCVNDFPLGAKPLLVSELRAFGAEITIEDDPRGFHGLLSHVSGRLSFEYDRVAERLFVTVTEAYGHFPVLLLIGGIRQTCQEAAERWRKQHAGV